MQLRDFTAALRRRKWVVLVCVLVFTFLGGLLCLTQPNKYAAHAQLFVATTDTGNGATSAYNGSLFSQQRVKSYADILANRSILEPVRRELSIPDPISSLQREVSATAPLDTVLINLT